MDENIKKHFEMKCKVCGCTDVDVFSSGDDGEVKIACFGCDNEVEV